MLAGAALSVDAGVLSIVSTDRFLLGRTGTSVDGDTVIEPHTLAAGQLHLLSTLPRSSGVARLRRNGDVLRVSAGSLEAAFAPASAGFPDTARVEAGRPGGIGTVTVTRSDTSGWWLLSAKSLVLGVSRDGLLVGQPGQGRPQLWWGDSTGAGALVLLDRARLCAAVAVTGDSRMVSLTIGHPDSGGVTSTRPVLVEADDPVPVATRVLVQPYRYVDEQSVAGVLAAARRAGL